MHHDGKLSSTDSYENLKALDRFFTVGAGSIGGVGGGGEEQSLRHTVSWQKASLSLSLSLSLCS